MNIAQEIATLRKEALAYKAVRDSLRSAETTDDAAKTVFHKVCPLGNRPLLLC
jgi:ubiquitin-like 1-activating enzyme E1 B